MYKSLKTKLKIKVDGKIIERIPVAVPFGNFVMLKVKYKNREYLLGGWDGDEYLRGMDKDKVYTLGKRLN